MPYVEWHSSIRHHWKTDLLMSEMRLKRYEALGIIGSLSAWAIEYRPDGVIERNLVGTVAIQDWPGDVNTLVRALVTCGWLDEVDQGTKVRIHAWDQITRGYRKARADVARRKGTAPPDVYLTPEPVRHTDDRDEPEVEFRPTEQTRVATRVTEMLVGIWNEGRAAATHIRVTPKRVAKVKTRLDDFTMAQLEQAVRALKASPFHNGQNDRNWKAPGPEWVLQSVEKVEEFLNRNGTRPAAPQATCRNCGGLAFIPRGTNGETRPCPSCPAGRAQAAAAGRSE